MGYSAATTSQQSYNTSPVASEVMIKRVECECSWSFEGTDDAIVTAVREHCLEAHGGRVPDLAQILAAAKPVESRDDAGR